MTRVNTTLETAGGGSPRRLRQLNSIDVLRAIRAAGPVSRTQVARLTGLSKKTVNEVVLGLLDSGHVLENVPDRDTQQHKPGPRARLLSFHADFGHVLGLDIGARKLLALVADLDGRILAVERCRLRDSPDADALLALATVAARAALDRANVTPQRLSAAAVGTPGVIDPSTGRVTLAPQLPGWEGMPLAARLAQELGCSCPVFADNEIHLAVLAERWLGAIQGIDDALCVQIGVGIGCGLLVGGELHRGANGAAGEIGSSNLLGTGEQTAPGWGPFEYAAGGSAFARLGRQAADGPEGALLRELAGGDPAAIDAEVVFAASARGDQAARQVLDELVGRLARGVAAAILLIDPATVVVGGGLSRAGEALLAPLERSVRRLVPFAPHFQLSNLGDEAVALGAVKVALQAADERLLAFGGGM